MRDGGLRIQIVKIDMDKPYDVAREFFWRRVQIYNSIAEEFGLPKIIRYEIAPSQSLKLHALLYLDRPTDCYGRYIIASLLGDDPVRSVLNLQRCISDADADILFFKKIELRRR